MCEYALKSASRRASTAAALSLLSLLGALAVCEVGLRLFHPKYEEVAQSQRYREDESRGWAPAPNTIHYRTHPDTGVHHPVIYNNFGSRQHRNFDADALKGAENVAFFGDSYVENSGIEAQYSFTEVLDFLLNLHRGSGGVAHDHSAFNVLNLGIDGYGPGQEFVWYQQFPHRDDLDHVFYVLCDNDIENFHRHRLFSLDDSGDLVPNEAATRGFMTTALSSLHLTYLFLDFGQRLNVLESTSAGPAPTMAASLPFGKVGPIHEINHRVMLQRRPERTPSAGALDDSVAAFQTLLLHWKDVVEGHGGEFHVVVLPYMSRDSVQAILPTQLDVVYLLDCFNRVIPQFNYSDWRFREDAHWNEAGNMVAAHCLYRLLERGIGLSPLSETDLANARHEYYSAVDTGNWDPPPAWTAPPARSALSRARIAAKYMALYDRRRILGSLQSSTPVARADWLVYQRERGPNGGAALAYVKTPCRKADTRSPFFLHVMPRDSGQLSIARSVFGFDNLDFNFADAWQAASAHDVSKEGWTLDDSCVFITELPPYEVARVRTGQYTADGPIWEVEIVFDGMASDPS